MEHTYMLSIQILSVLVFFNKVHAKSVASGNAMDLAQLNMNMMHNGCPLLPCQSACTVKNADTGCYECTAACGTANGAVIGNPNMQNPMQSPNNGQYYGCIPNWVGCPSHCTMLPDQRGCFHCQCNSRPSSTTVQGVQQTSTVPGSPNTQTTPETTFTTKTPIQSTRMVTQSNNASVVATSPVLSTYSSLQNATGNSKNKTFKDTTSNDTDQLTKWTKNQTNTLEYNSLKYTEHLLFSSTTTQSNTSSLLKTRNDDVDYFKYTIVIITISSVGGILLISSILFFILWQRSAKILRKQSDELYFVKKAQRQDSQSRLTNHDMLEPVYAHVQSTPEPPPRRSPNSPLTPTAPSSDGFTRNVSCSSQTILKKNNRDTYSHNHDYLELI